MHNNYIKDLLGFKDVNIKRIESDEKSITFHIETKKFEQVCPRCGSHTSKVHDYHTQTIKDAPIFFKKTFIHLRKRRYKCKFCGKQFFEDLDFLPKFYRMTNRLSVWIYDKLLTTNSIKQIASAANVSSNTVLRVLKLFNVSKYIFA